MKCYILSNIDVVSAFLEACCVVGQGEVKSSNLYSAYCQWAELNNEYRMSNTKFGIELAKRFEKIKKPEGLFYKGLFLG